MGAEFSWVLKGGLSPVGDWHLLLLVSLSLAGTLDCGPEAPSMNLLGLGWAFSNSGQGAMVCKRRQSLLKGTATDVTGA